MYNSNQTLHKLQNELVHVHAFSTPYLNLKRGKVEAVHISNM